MKHGFVSFVLVVFAAAAVVCLSVFADDLTMYPGGPSIDLNGKVLNPTPAPTPAPITIPPSTTPPPAPTATPVPTPDPNINTYLGKTPYTFVRGGVRYTDFAWLPDFGQYAQIDNYDIAVYPTNSQRFQYLGADSVYYTYSTVVRDYLDTSVTEKLEQYKTVINLTFKQKFLPEINSLPDYYLELAGVLSQTAKYPPNGGTTYPFAEYMGGILLDLRYDPYYTVDNDGIFIQENFNENTFYLLLIGTSKTTNANGALVDCIEFRFYSLTRNTGSFNSILDAQDELSTVVPNGGNASLFTPNVSGEIKTITVPSDLGLSTPNAANEINTVTPPGASGLTTPKASDELQSVPLPSDNIPTPDVFDDLKKTPPENYFVN